MRTRTKQEIYERYLSAESEDDLGVERTALLCMLPYEQAKPYLDPKYVKQSEAGELQEDELWKDDWDIKAQILQFIGPMYRAMERNRTFDLITGFLSLKAWIWVEDPDFYDAIEQELLDVDIESQKGLLDKIANHYGYEESIQDIPFEEIEKSESELDSDS